MQIIRGGKVSRLHDLLVIRWKTFAIAQQFETPCNKKEKFAGKLSRLEANPRKPQKFSTVNDLHYTVIEWPNILLKQSAGQKIYPANFRVVYLCNMAMLICRFKFPQILTLLNACTITSVCKLPT